MAAFFKVRIVPAGAGIECADQHKRGREANIFHNPRDPDEPRFLTVGAVPLRNCAGIPVVHSETEPLGAPN